MLRELRIENLLLIERAELRLFEGLNAITGETGAGKTILAHSLDLLLGGRARPQIVRPGADEAYVEGIFTAPHGLLDDPELAELAERLPEGSGEIVLGRRVGASGRTSAFVQGRSASAADLRALGQRLLAFYGQHEHRRLSLASAQLDVLDGFAGPEQLERAHGYARVHREVERIGSQLGELAEREGARERDLDLFRFELEEIEATAPDPEEEQELAAESERLRHAGRLREAAGGGLAAIAGSEEGVGGARALTGEAHSVLGGVAGVDEALDRIAEQVEALGHEMDDVAGTLRSYVDGIEAEPGRLEQVEERLEALDRLKRKHGRTIEAVLSHGERCRAEIERLESAGQLTDELRGRLAVVTAERAALAGAMSSARRSAAGGLERRAVDELAELAMDGASLNVALEPHPHGHGPAGGETVEFRIATNPGIPPSPLRDAASGGELSRIMLALTVLGGAPATPEQAPAMVFDEIDAGIGGNTAHAVGERLRRLGADRQVVCITHLPQVASLAQAHFRVAKQVRGGETLATVERVEGEELVGEICRMLGADLSDEAASRHARELLKAA